MTQHVVITGASSGIGLALVELYRQKGCKVTALVRQASPELESTGADIFEGIDIQNNSVQAAIRQVLGDDQVDVLINNAGMWGDEVIGQLDYEGMTTQWQVNALGALRVTEAVLPNMGQGSRIALITSRMGSIEDNGSGGRYGYRMSKAALNAAGKSLAIDLKGRGISVAVLHPGFVSTRMVGFNGQISAEASAQMLDQRIEGLTLESSGTFWHANGEVLPW